MRRKKPSVKFTLFLPVELHQKLKVSAALREVTMTRIVVVAMERITQKIIQNHKEKLNPQEDPEISYDWEDEE